MRGWPFCGSGPRFWLARNKKIHRHPRTLLPRPAHRDSYSACGRVNKPLLPRAARNFMHENRETSQTPAARVSRRTAGEGLGHTARMYVCEESDSGIVPMNHSNKDGKPVGGE